MGGAALQVDRGPGTRARLARDAQLSRTSPPRSPTTSPRHRCASKRVAPARSRGAEVAPLATDAAATRLRRRFPVLSRPRLASLSCPCLCLNFVSRRRPRWPRPGTKRFKCRRHRKRHLLEWRPGTGHPRVSPAGWKTGRRDISASARRDTNYGCKHGLRSAMASRAPGRQRVYRRWPRGRASRCEDVCARSCAEHVARCYMSDGAAWAHGVCALRTVGNA